MWHALGGAAGSTWIFTGGPSILRSARCGHVLKVEEAYLSSSHALILSLLVGMHGNGSSAGRLGVGSSWGHERVASYEVLEAMHPLLMDRSVLTVSDSCTVSEVLVSLIWLSDFRDNEKIADRTPRLSSDSYDRYIDFTELLTYIMELHDSSLPL